MKPLRKSKDWVTFHFHDFKENEKSLTMSLGRMLRFHFEKGTVPSSSNWWRPGEMNFAQLFFKGYCNFPVKTVVFLKEKFFDSLNIYTFATWI